MLKNTLTIQVAASALALVACQPQGKPVAVIAKAPVAVRLPTTDFDRVTSGKLGDSVVSAVPDRVAARPGVVKPSPPLSNLSAYLAANNLAPLWQSSFGEAGQSQTAPPRLLQGVYGEEHRYIAFLLDHVRQEAAQPTLFRVRGRSRYRHAITPFEGTITVHSLTPLRTRMFWEDMGVDSAALSHPVCTAAASFAFHEDPAVAGSGTFCGTALLDFYRLSSGALNLCELPTPNIPDKQLPTRGTGMLFRGQWLSRHTPRRQAVAFAPDVRAVLPGALADLFLGERSEVLNPKYARLGWDEYWENDEWWADSAKPKPGL